MERKVHCSNELESSFYVSNNLLVDFAKSLAKKTRNKMVTSVFGEALQSLVLSYQNLYELSELFFHL